MKEKSMKIMPLAAIGTLLLAIVTLIGIAVVDQVGYSLRDPTTITNETITATNGTAVNLANDYVISYYSFTAYNDTARTNTVPSTAYDVNYDDGSITNVLSGTYGTAWSVDYTYGASNSIVTTATLFQAGLIVFGTFMSLITLVLVGSLIINFVKNDKE